MLSRAAPLSVRVSIQPPTNAMNFIDRYRLIYSLCWKLYIRNQSTSYLTPKLTGYPGALRWHNFYEKFHSVPLTTTTKGHQTDKVRCFAYRLTSVTQSVPPLACHVTIVNLSGVKICSVCIYVFALCPTFLLACIQFANALRVVYPCMMKRQLLINY